MPLRFMRRGISMLKNKRRIRLYLISITHKIFVYFLDVLRVDLTEFSTYNVNITHIFYLLYFHIAYKI